MLGRVILVAGLLTISAVAHSATRSRAVLESPLDVPAVTWKSIPIVVTSAMPDARLQGDIRASGGTGNDIEILVMTESDWTNFSNGHHAEALFKSGRTTVSTLDVPLPQGAYRLVFSNTFSGITPKRITGSVLINWYPSSDAHSSAGSCCPSECVACDERTPSRWRSGWRGASGAAGVSRRPPGAAASRRGSCVGGTGASSAPARLSHRAARSSRSS